MNPSIQPSRIPTPFSIVPKSQVIFEEESARSRRLYWDIVMFTVIVFAIVCSIGLWCFYRIVLKEFEDRDTTLSQKTPTYSIHSVLTRDDPNSDAAWNRGAPPSVTSTLILEKKGKRVGSFHKDTGEFIWE